jgi:hypothetical protein
MRTLIPPASERIPIFMWGFVKAAVETGGPLMSSRSGIKLLLLA